MARKQPQKVGFIRLESYGFKSSKGRRTITGIINEMTRRPSAIPHVSAPSAELPLFCPFGPPSSAITLIRQKVAEFDSQSPKRMRKDAQLLVAGVASFPMETVEMMEDGEAWGWFAKFCKLVVKFLREEFADRLHSVVAHIDEGFPHVHFLLLPYAVPENGGKLGIGANHPGKHADDRTGDRRAKYKAAMKAFLDRFHGAVGKEMGWDRIGKEPRQRNPNRKQYIWFRDLWETLTNDSDEAGDAAEAKPEALALVERPVLALPAPSPTPSANAKKSPKPQTAPIAAPKPRKKPAPKVDEIDDMQRDGNENETIKKRHETFHSVEKRSVSPMRPRF